MIPTFSLIVAVGCEIRSTPSSRPRRLPPRRPRPPSAPPVPPDARHPRPTLPARSPSRGVAPSCARTAAGDGRAGGPPGPTTEVRPAPRCGGPAACRRRGPRASGGQLIALFRVRSRPPFHLDQAEDPLVLRAERPVALRTVEQASPQPLAHDGHQPLGTPVSRVDLAQGAVEDLVLDQARVGDHDGGPAKRPRDDVDPVVQSQLYQDPACEGVVHLGSIHPRLTCLVEQEEQQVVSDCLHVPHTPRPVGPVPGGTRHLPPQLVAASAMACC